MLKTFRIIILFLISINSIFLLQSCQKSKDGKEPQTKNGVTIIQKFNTDYAHEISVSAIQEDGKLIVGTSNGIFRVNTDGSIDESFQPDGSISRKNMRYTAISILDNGKILVACSPFPITAGYQGLYRLNPNGKIDNSFTPNISGGSSGSPYVQAIFQIGNGDIIVGGNFSKVDNRDYVYHLARLSSSGRIVPSFNNKIHPSNGNRAIGIFPVGNTKFMATGSLFTNSLLGVLRANAIVFDFNGEIDESFSFTEEMWVQYPIPLLKEIYASSSISDGSYLIGGDFDALMHISSTGNKINSTEFRGTVQCIVNLDNNTFLIGSSGSLSIYNKSTNSVEDLSLGFELNGVNEIYKENDNSYLLVGTFSNTAETTNIIRVKL